MSAPILSLPPDSTLRDALHLFNTRHIHGAPVIGDGDLERDNYSFRCNKSD